MNNHLHDLVNPDCYKEKTTVRRFLTGSRIDNMKLLYNTIADIFDEEQSDELNKTLLIQEVMKRTRVFLTLL